MAYFDFPDIPTERREGAVKFARLTGANGRCLCEKIINSCVRIEGIDLGATESAPVAFI